MSWEQLELIDDAKADLGEGPIWDANSQTLYWVDITRKNLHSFHRASGNKKVIQVGHFIGTAVLRESGGLVLALENGFHAFDPETGKLTFLADPEKDNKETRFNDGKCDPAGRFWAGTMAFDERPDMGTLYCLDTNLQVRTMAGPVTVSNGLGWSPDHRTMYYIDSPTRCVVAYDYDLEAGTIANRRIVVEIPDGEGFPDGMTVDEEGMLWVAQWDGYRVSRWNPETGQRLDQIMLPAARVSCCVFGGPELNELYITTARSNLSEADLQKQPTAGGLHRVKTHVKGMPAAKFKG